MEAAAQGIDHKIHPLFSDDFKPRKIPGKLVLISFEYQGWYCLVAM